MDFLTKIRNTALVLRGTTTDFLTKIRNTEPLLFGQLALSLVTAGLSALVLRGAITDTQASTLTQVLVPLVTAGLTWLAGLVIRLFVSPASVKPSPASTPSSEQAPTPSQVADVVPPAPLVDPTH